MDRQREELIANIEGKLQQKNRRQELLALRWNLAWPAWLTDGKGGSKLEWFHFGSMRKPCSR